jgi:transketolase
MIGEATEVQIGTAGSGLAKNAAVAEIAQRIRRYAVIGIHHAGSGHPGGALSAADILAVLYHEVLDLGEDPQNNPSRDRFILSKGHACPALYGAWAALGLIDADLIPTLRKLGSPLQGHPHLLETPLAETSTGSLGQGFSVSIGVAIGLRQQEITARTYALLGDGELQEGEVWEAAMCAAHYQLNNLCAVIDYNKLQSDDYNANIMGLEPLAEKWRAFGWNVIEIDGHDYQAIRTAFADAAREATKPTVIIANTIKGKGVSYMEDAAPWHGSVKMSEEDTATALSELDLQVPQIQNWIDGHVE